MNDVELGDVIIDVPLSATPEEAAEIEEAIAKKVDFVDPENTDEEV